MDRIVVESAEVARAVVFHETVNHRLLLRGAGEGACLFEIFHDAFQSRAVKSAHAPNALGEVAELIAHEAAVHAHHDGLRVVGRLALRVEALGLCLRDAGGIVVGG